MFQQMLAIWSLVPLPFLKPAWTSGSSQFMYSWSLAWRILSITLLASDISTIVQYSEHYLALPFFGIGMKTDLFQSCGHCWVFQICWNIECSTFTASSFRTPRDSVSERPCLSPRTQSPTETEPDLLLSICVSPAEERVTVACCWIRDTECGSTYMEHFEGGHHYLHHLHHSLVSGQQQGGNTAPPIDRKLD